MANILVTTWRFLDLLATRQASVERELVNAYAAVWDRLEDDASAVAARIAGAIEDGTDISPAWLYQEERYRILQAQTQAEIARISRGLGPSLTQLQAEAVVLGDAAARAMLAEQGVTGLVRLPNDQLIDLVGRLSNGSPLRAVLDELGPDASQRIQNALLSGIGTGQGTDAIARQIRDALGGNMARAQHIARTESVGSYRRAAQRNAMQHADIMEGWRWSASLMNVSPPPCFPAGTIIETSRGKVPIEDVVIGDQVLTHHGRYKTVQERHRTLRRHQFVTVTAGASQVVATQEHPFLVEREGSLNWIEARELVSGDKVFSVTQGVTNHLDGISSKRSVQRCIRNAKHAIAACFKPFRLASILSHNSLTAMPVDTVHFNHRVHARDVKINRITPARENMFLQKRNAQFFKAAAHIGFWFSFAGIAAIATGRTEAPAQPFRWNNPKLFSAVKALNQHCRTATLFRAIPATRVFFNESFAASVAHRVISIARSTGERTIRMVRGYTSCFRECCAAAGARLMNMRLARLAPRGTVRTMYKVSGNARRQPEGFAAVSTLLLNLSCQLLARKRTIFLRFPTCSHSKLLATVKTRFLNRWTCYLAALCMRMFSLVFRIARTRTEPSATFTNPRLRNIEDRIALDTSTFHPIIITNVAPHIHSIDTFVYNIAVEQDESYVANGFAVHNCPVCLSMHGQTFPLDTPFESHISCRCVPVFITKGSRVDFGPSGEEWFAGQPDDYQRSVLRKGEYAAYSAGDLELADLVKYEVDPEWGGSRTRKPLRDVFSAKEAQDYSRMEAD